MTDQSEIQKCANCMFWLRWKETSGTKQVWGNCRRSAGQVVLIGRDLRTKQPLKQEEDWCGDWEGLL